MLTFRCTLLIPVHQRLKRIRNVHLLMVFIGTSQYFYNIIIYLLTFIDIHSFFLLIIDYLKYKNKQKKYNLRNYNRPNGGFVTNWNFFYKLHI